MTHQTLANYNISFHRETCTVSECKNKDVCYHLKKGNLPSFMSHSIWHVFLSELLEKYSNSKIYDSLCINKIDILRSEYLRNHDNYNLTLPHVNNEEQLFNYYFKNKHLDQLQVTIYDLKFPNYLKNITKIFLIKDYDTLYKFKELYNMDESKLKSLGKIHFAIDESFITKDIIKTILHVFFSEKVKIIADITIDTCLTNFVVNGKCPYTKDYIDISQDLSYRYCPFKKEKDGQLSIDNVIDLELPSDINEEKKCRNCNYNKIFNGEPI